MTTADGQVAAARPRLSAWVDASAGTGKTKVLVDRVLRLLLTGTPPARILCLTFTRAAAAEMANRIRATLGDWTRATPERLAAALADLLEVPPEGRTLERARGLIATVLDTPGGMKIQTIHAFCEAVLRRFPLEARLSPNFTVLDERSARETLRAARDRLVETSSGETGEALQLIAGRIVEFRFDDLMQRFAAERGKASEISRAESAALYRYLGIEPGRTAADLLDRESRDEAFDRPGLAAAAAALAAGSETDRDRASRIASWIADPERRAERFLDYAQAFLTAGRKVRKTLATGQTAQEARAPLAAEADRVQRIIHRYLSYKTAQSSMSLTRVMRSLLDAYEAGKRADAALDYEDLIEATRRLLRDDAAASWVHYKLDGGIDHVLIDEAQDTSPDQWRVIASLTSDFFSDRGAGGALTGPPRTIFAVGDPKQSIYSFQGADPDAFRRMEAFYGQAVAALGAEWRSVALNASFRATPAVLRSVDAVFAGGDPDLGLGAPPTAHAARRTGQAGSVVLWPPAYSVEPTRDRDDRAAPVSGAGEPASFRLAAAMSQKIVDWIAGSEPLPSHARTVRAGDILVLVRRRTAFVDQLVRALKRAGIGVAGVDRLVLSDHLAAMDLLALAEAALLPTNDLVLATVLKGPLFGIDEETLFALAHDRGGRSLFSRLAEAARQCPDLAGILAALREISAAAERGPPFEFYMHVLSVMGGRQKIVARLGADAEDPIDEFLSLSLDYERRHPPSLQGFVAWFRAASTEVKRDLERAGRDEVRVMTVHGAKGLEAPIVILADTMERPFDRNPLFWPETPDGDRLLIWRPRRDDEDPTSERLGADARRRAEEEYWRLLYVAMTRSQDRLHVAGYRDGDNIPDDCWYRVVERALDRIPDVEESEMTLRAAGITGWTGRSLRLSSPQTEPPDRVETAIGRRTVVDPLPGWARRPAPVETPRAAALAPSHLGAAGDRPAPTADGGNEGADRGRIVHELLRALPDVDARAREDAAWLFLGRPSLGLDMRTREELAAEALGVLSAPQTARFFAPRSRGEVPIAGLVGGQRYSGRVDRLVVDETTIDVLDFKTERRPPKRVEDTPSGHLRQLAVYRALLRRIYPGRTVRSLLVWTAIRRVDAIPDALLDAHAP